jgi:hypothetical protein
MSIRTLFIIAIVLVVVMIVVVLMVLSGTAETSPEEPSVVIPAFPVGQFPPSELYSEKKISLPTVEEVVAVRNFLSDADVSADLTNPGYYRLGPPTAADSRFEITYIAQTSFFIVTLLQPPFGEARAAAEKALMERLGIDRETLCTLRYSVGVPGYIDQVASGTDYGFGVCADGLPLP